MLLEPAAGRWPDHEQADRLALAVGVLAHCAQRSSDPGWETLGGTLTALAQSLAAAGGDPLPGDLVPMQAFGPRGPLVVVPWEGPARPRIRAELVPAAVAPAVVLRDPPPRGSRTLPVAALALMLALAADADADGRLALALVTEGILGWYRESHRLHPDPPGRRLRADPRRRPALRGRPPGAARPALIVSEMASFPGCLTGCRPFPRRPPASPLQAFSSPATPQ